MTRKTVDSIEAYDWHNSIFLQFFYILPLDEFYNFKEEREQLIMFVMVFPLGIHKQFLAIKNSMKIKYGY